jgi:hypothetical protein
VEVLPALKVIPCIGMSMDSRGNGSTWELARLLRSFKGPT